MVVWLGNVGVKPKAPEEVLLGNVEAWLEMYHQDRTIIHPHHGKT